MGATDFFQAIAEGVGQLDGGKFFGAQAGGEFADACEEDVARGSLRHGLGLETRGGFDVAREFDGG